MTCRCSGDSPSSQNPEYKWAKNYLGHMKDKIKKIKKIIVKVII